MTLSWIVVRRDRRMKSSLFNGVMLCLLVLCQRNLMLNLAKWWRRRTLPWSRSAMVSPCDRRLLYSEMSCHPHTQINKGQLKPQNSNKYNVYVISTYTHADNLAPMYYATHTYTTGLTQPKHYRSWIDIHTKTNKKRRHVPCFGWVPVRRLARGSSSA